MPARIRSSHRVSTKSRDQKSPHFQKHLLQLLLQLLLLLFMSMIYCLIKHLSTQLQLSNQKHLSAIAQTHPLRRLLLFLPTPFLPILTISARHRCLQISILRAIRTSGHRCLQISIMRAIRTSVHRISITSELFCASHLIGMFLVSSLNSNSIFPF